MGHTGTNFVLLLRTVSPEISVLAYTRYMYLRRENSCLNLTYMYDKVPKYVLAHLWFLIPYNCDTSYCICYYIIFVPGMQSGCFYKDQVYKQDDTWKVGCQYKCTCVNAVKNEYRCRDL